MLLANLFSERIPDWLGWLLIALNLIIPAILMNSARKKIKDKAAWLILPAIFCFTFLISVIVLIIWVGYHHPRQDAPVNSETSDKPSKIEQPDTVHPQQNGANPASNSH